MPTAKRKAFAYVTHRDRLLVLSHPNAPSAGIQVPAGTIEPGERPEQAVLREAHEETGLERLRLVRYLGDDVRDMRDLGRDELHHRYFFHLACEGDPPASWRRSEMHASAPGAGMPLFELFWAPLPDGVPELIADHGRLLRWLVELMGLAEYRPPGRVAARPESALPREPAIVAEGPGLFPECVAPVIADRRRAIWLLPTDEFKLASARRSAGSLCSTPLYFV
ncbi:MAG TPA: NUDIX domain-containing protein [Chloroflexota bacterium]